MNRTNSASSRGHSLDALLCGGVTLLITALPVTGQQIRGRVVDEPTRQAVRDASVMLFDSARVMLTGVATGADGFFLLQAHGPGEYVVVVQHPGFAEISRTVTVAGEDLLVPAFVLRTEAILLDSIAVQGRANRGAETEAGFQRTSHVLAGARLAQLEAASGRMATVVNELSSIRVREWSDRGRPRICVESVRGPATLQGDAGACRWVTIVLDGITMGDPEQTFRGLSVSAFESVEYLPPAEAALLYGMSAGTNGALVLWTRGRGPHVNPNRRP